MYRPIRLYSPEMVANNEKSLTIDSREHRTHLPVILSGTKELSPVPVAGSILENISPGIECLRFLTDIRLEHAHSYAG